MKAPKRLHYLCLLAVFLCIALQGNTQEKTVTGRVVDVSNSPFVGVTVTIKNKNTATRTNEKGDYSITALENDILVFTHIQYISFEQIVGNSSEINVTLNFSTNSLQKRFC